MVEQRSPKPPVARSNRVSPVRSHFGETFFYALPDVRLWPEEVFSQSSFCFSE